jgi:hypothetical protein
MEHDLCFIHFIYYCLSSEVKVIIMYQTCSLDGEHECIQHSCEHPYILERSYKLKKYVILKDVNNKGLVVAQCPDIINVCGHGKSLHTDKQSIKFYCMCCAYA